MDSEWLLLYVIIKILYFPAHSNATNVDMLWTCFWLSECSRVLVIGEHRSDSFVSRKHSFISYDSKGRVCGRCRFEFIIAFKVYVVYISETFLAMLISVYNAKWFGNVHLNARFQTSKTLSIRSTYKPEGFLWSSLRFLSFPSKHLWSPSASKYEEVRVWFLQLHSTWNVFICNSYAIH